MIERRIKTNIKGFDEHLEGGIPKEQVVLIAGTAGTLKSSIGFNILHSNAQDKGFKSLYISLEQSRKSLIKQMSKLGMEVLPEEDMTVVDLGIVRKNLSGLGENQWFHVFKMKVEDLHKNLGYNLLLVDSLNALEVMAKLDKPREELFKMFEWLRDMGMTALLILETDPHGVIGKNGESFLADGIITLDMEDVNAIDVQRRIRCLKMRGIHHHTGYFNLVFKENKFQVTKAITP